MTGPSMLDAALAYAARGWPVFPCKPGRKDPLTAHGVLDATTSPEQIRAWWQRWPDANVAIATGTPGPDVLDVECDGYPALAELTTAGMLDGYGDMVRTRSGGLHVYYAGTTQRNGSIKGRRVDFRGQGGYVIAPPSAVDADDKPGGTYQHLQRADATGVLDWRIARDLLDPPPQPQPFQQPGRDASQPRDGRAGDQWAAVTDWPAILAPAGWTLARTLPGGVRYWRRPGKQGPGISASTRDDGGFWPWTTSTEFDPETPYTKLGVYTVLNHGGDYKAAAAALARQGYGAPATVTAAGVVLAAGSDADLAAIAARYTAVDWQQAWAEQPDDVRWLLEPVLEAGTANALFAQPGTGKSLLAIDLARQLAAAGHVVVYVDDENRIADVVERLQDMGCTPAELDRLRFYSFAGLPPLDTAEGGRHLLALAVACGAALVILDTTSRMVAGKENDSDTFLQLYRCSLVPLKARGITTLRLDHPGKDVSRGQRGSSAKSGDVDTIWRLDAIGADRFRLDREKSRSGYGPAAVMMTRHLGPLRHEFDPFASPPGAVIAAKLDDLGLPPNAGRPAVRQALAAAGIQVGNEELQAALRYRKSPAIRPNRQTGHSQAPDLTGPSGQSRDRRDETAGQEAGQLTRSVSGQPVSSADGQLTDRTAHRCGQLVSTGLDQSTPFYDDACGGTHPIGEHADCRESRL